MVTLATEINELVPGKRVLTVGDKRQIFSCLKPTIIERLNRYRNLALKDTNFDENLGQPITDLVCRLNMIFTRNKTVVLIRLENLRIGDLIEGLKRFQQTIDAAGPDDLSYINHRIIFILNNLD